MEELRQALRVIHIALGLAGLGAFWVPIASRKGGRVHRIAGRVFESSAYGVAATATVATVIIAADAPAGAAGDGVRGQAALLAYLALVTLAAVRHGVRAVRLKSPDEVVSPLHQALGWATVSASIALLVYGVVTRPPNTTVLLALSPVGVVTGSAVLRYTVRSARTTRAWWYAHMSGMLIAGIAFHTAFAVFGSSRLLGFELDPPLALVPWLLPTVVGVAAIRWWTARSRGRYGAGPARPTAEG